MKPVLAPSSFPNFDDVTRNSEEGPFSVLYHQELGCALRAFFLVISTSCKRMGSKFPILRLTHEDLVDKGVGSQTTPSLDGRGARYGLAYQDRDQGT